MTKQYLIENQWMNLSHKQTIPTVKSQNNINDGNKSKKIKQIRRNTSMVAAIEQNYDFTND